MQEPHFTIKHDLYTHFKENISNLTVVIKLFNVILYFEKRKNHTH